MTMTTTIPDTTLMTTDELASLMAERPDVRILDVRTGSEFETVHIPGSFNVPLDTLAEHATDLADVDHPVVLVCQSGSRASQAHAHLTGAGKQALHILDGGMAAWLAADGKVIRATNAKWAMDRQVRLVAGSLVLTGIVASIAVPRAKWLAGGVAGGLVFSAVSNTCAMANVLGKLPYNKGAGCDIERVLSDMKSTTTSRDERVAS
jgi:rhodanese-related sulfurtransferase